MEYFSDPIGALMLVYGIVDFHLLAVYGILYFTTSRKLATYILGKLYRFCLNFGSDQQTPESAREPSPDSSAMDTTFQHPGERHITLPGATGNPDTLISRLELLEAGHKKLSDEFNTLQCRLMSTADDLAKEKSRADSAEATNAQLTAICGSLQARVTELERMDKQNDTDIRSLRESLGQLDTKTTRANDGRISKQHEHEGMIEQLSFKFTTVTQRATDMADDLTAVRQQVSILVEANKANHAGGHEHAHAGAGAWRHVHGAGGTTSKQAPKPPAQAKDHPAAPAGSTTFIMSAKPGTDVPAVLLAGKGDPLAFAAGMLRSAGQNTQLQITRAKSLLPSHAADGRARAFAVCFTVPTSTDAAMVHSIMRDQASELCQAWRLRSVWPLGVRERLAPLIEQAKAAGLRWRASRDHSQLMVQREQGWVALQPQARH